MSTTETAGSGGEKTWFGHPRPLALLFTTEAWERFGYYGMRALLILYLVEHFVFADRVANGLYGAFTSLVYLTPLIGGFIADRYLGNKNSVKLGAVLMSAGYLMLAFTGGDRADPFVTIGGARYEVAIEKQGEETTQYVVADGQRHRIIGNEDGSLTLEGAGGALPATVAQGGYQFDAERNPISVILLFASLGLIIVGNGYFKPNISTIVGDLYSQTDRRRDAGFTIFYMGINLGSIFSQFLAPIIAGMYGYQWGFALAGFGMLFAAIRFQLASANLKDYGNPPADAPKRGLVILIGSLLAVPVIWFLMNNAMEAASHGGAHDAAGGIVGFLMAQPLLGQIMFGVYILAMVGLPIWALAGLDKEARSKLIVAVVLCIFSVVFWTLFEQAGSSLTLFAERNTDRNLGVLPIVGEYVMPAGQAQVFNPLFIVIMAPLFSLMWNWLGARKLEPSVPFKFVIALALVGIGFLALVFGAQFHNEQFQVALFWLALAYFIHSVGELCISPVGLSMITKLSPAKMVGLMMGVWFMSSAMAQYAGGIIAQFASTETVGGQVLNPEVSLNTYLGVFQTIGIWGLGAAGVLLLLAPFLQKGMQGIR
ncbi:MAG: peptide MFS transporter [Hyphomonadaceae bacterium]|jgi:POT family proton-dependent oligopeptide transporter|nr:peptide MFS transporter [Hyphomonadaceae bacterium]